MKHHFRKKVFPFPALLFLVLLLISFLLGDDRNLGGVLFLLLLFLGLWYFLGPDLETPPEDVLRSLRGQSRPLGKEPSQDPRDVLQGAALWMWSWRLYRDRAYRNRYLALALGLLLGGTAALILFDTDVIFWRAALILGLCALGLLLLFWGWLRRRLRSRREEQDRAEAPALTVKLTYDHDAAGEARVRALRLRLDRLEEWKRSGLIDDAEYEQLRKKHLKQ